MKYDAHGGNTFAYENIRLDFSVNLNPLGMPREIIEAVQENADKFDAYPDTECRELKRLTAAWENVPEDYIVFGNGAADIIIRICLALRPGKALVTAPAFSEYEKAVREAGGSVERFPLKESDGFLITPDFAGAISPDTDMMFLCTPNNPTGRLTPLDTIREAADACRKAGAVLVIDECFLSFTEGKSCKCLFDEYKNVIVLKAFTKMFSMAGLRLGYMLCPDREIANLVFSVGQSWSVSTPAQVAGAAAMKLYDRPEKTREYLAKERPRVIERLRSIGIKVFDSDANYLLFKDREELWQSCLKEGILIRSWENFHGLDGSFFRIGLKTPEKNDILLDVLEKIISSR